MAEIVPTFQAAKIVEHVFIYNFTDFRSEPTARGTSQKATYDCAGYAASYQTDRSGDQSQGGARFRPCSRTRHSTRSART
jgi:hypothetical protein